MRKLTKSILYAMLSVQLAFPATYYVKKTGNDSNVGSNASPWLTIGKCASTIVAGDTCTVFVGTYNEVVTLTTNGTGIAQITYTVNSGDTAQVYGFSLDADYNTISGFLITDPALSHAAAGVDVPHAHSYDQITNNVITQVGMGYPCITTHGSGAAVSYFTISGNTVSWCNAVPGQPNASAETGVALSGDHFLVENNTLSHVTNGFTGSFDHTIIRGNTMGNTNDAVDFPGCNESTCDEHWDGIEWIPANGLCCTVAENNVAAHIRGVGGAHALGILENSNGTNNTNTIIRFNSAYDADAWWTSDIEGTWGSVKDYNNTANLLGQQSSQEGVVAFQNQAGSSLYNDIFYNVISPPGGTFNWYQLLGSTSSITSGYNLLYDSTCGSGCSYLPLASTDASNIKGLNPLLNNPSSLNFSLAAGSPAIAAGTYLTTVAAGDTHSGTSLVVNDAGFFQDSFGIPGVSPDCISVTTVGNHVCIAVSGVNYATNTLTMASGFTRASGDRIWLYSNSSGTIVLTGTAPDVGSNPYSSPLSPPTSLYIGVFTGSIGTGIPAPITSCGSSFLHCRSVTWDHAQAGSADTANFVGLVNETETDWKTAANGGTVQNTVNQSGGSYTSTIPADFIFATDETCATPVVGWEFESYTATTGALIVWVNIGTLSHTSDSSVWACYDKALVTTQQATVASTWNSNYRAVYHFAGSLGLQDSTSNGFNLTAGTGASSGAGQIGNGVVLDGSNGALIVNSFSLGTNIVTAEAWVYSSTMTTQNSHMFIDHEPINGSWVTFDSLGSLVLRGGDLSNDLTAGTGLSNSTWESTAGTITGTSGAVYVQANQTTGTVTPFTDAANQLDIAEYGGGSGLFVGSIDEVRVSNNARAASYFTARYNQEKPSQTMVTVGGEM